MLKKRKISFILLNINLIIKLTLLYSFPFLLNSTFHFTTPFINAYRQQDPSSGTLLLLSHSFLYFKPFPTLFNVPVLAHLFTIVSTTCQANGGVGHLQSVFYFTF